MIKSEQFTAPAGGIRLDVALLAKYPQTSRAFVREAIESGNVLVNSRRVVKGMKLRGGETINVMELKSAADNVVRPDESVCLDTVYEDESILAFDKPPGIPVQPLNCNECGTLMNGVVARYPECRELGDRPLMAGAIHRIDADTSGLVLVARNADAFNALRSQFTAQSVKKTYLALVEGHFTVGGTLENDLIHDPTLPFCRMIDSRKNRLTNAEREKARPLHAVTSFIPVGFTRVENEERTLLRVEIFTGVTHQIRAQLAMAGMHIVNDRLYGAFAVEGQIGHCLHALSAEFLHPLSGERMVVSTRHPSWGRL